MTSTVLRMRDEIGTETPVAQFLLGKVRSSIYQSLARIDKYQVVM